MEQKQGERRAVLVMPDVGLSEEEMQGLQGEFQNSIVGTLKKGGVDMMAICVIVVIVVVFG